jgi:CheY-like chemotaxis protein
MMKVHAMQVLFVDDDIDDREFFVDALSYVDPNINCVLAKDCEEALAILDHAGELPTYIFLDIHMPAMSGESCLRKIKSDARYEHIKVVMYSNASDEKLMEEYKKLGATYFLIKPPTFKDLCDSLAVMFQG